jgi:hypothetical protein
MIFQYVGGDMEWKADVTFSHALVPADQEPEPDEWSAWSALAVAEIQAQEWGEYTFHVRARDRVHNIDPTPSTWPVHIVTPLWAELWFQLTAGGKLVLLVLSASFALGKQRQARRSKEELLQRMQQELEEARQLQLSMLPSDKPSLPHLDIAWYMETATEVGGDYYDYSLAPDGILTFTLGDATGHGLNAGSGLERAVSRFGCRQ